MKGYRDGIVEMSNGRHLKVRTRASVLAQVKEMKNPEGLCEHENVQL